MFFNEWEEAINTNKSDYEFIKAFLCTEDGECADYQDRDDEYISTLVRVITRIPTKQFFEVLRDIKIRDYFESYEIPIFNNWEFAMNRVPELLQFDEEGLTFKKLGSKLIGNDNAVNTQKYGEVSAKVAALMKLAMIIRSKPQRAKSTNLGRYLIGYDIEKKRTLVKPILLQNPFVQSVVYHALYSEGFQYLTWVSILSDTTRMRRRQNTRSLLSFILDGTGEEERFDHIIWRL